LVSNPVLRRYTKRARKPKVICRIYSDDSASSASGDSGDEGERDQHAVKGEPSVWTMCLAYFLVHRLLTTTHLFFSRYGMTLTVVPC
jgi:hypothetical protein